MTTNQEGRQAAIRTETSTTHPLTGDWHALFDTVPIANGTWNERLLAWINEHLGESYTSLPGAMHAFAANGGFDSWSSMNTVDAAGGAPATTPAQDLVDTWASGGAGSDGFAMVFEDSGGTDAPSIYVKDSGNGSNDTDINLTDDFDAFNSFLTYTSPSPKITRQSDGDLKYCAHNLYLNSASPANQSITVTSGATYAVTITGSVSVTASGAATGTWTAGTNTFTAATTTLTLGSTSGSGTVHVYRTPADTTYLATTGSIRYALPIQYDSSNNAEGLLVEPAATNKVASSLPRNGVWSVFQAVLVDNSATSPSGESTASFLREDTSTGGHSAYISLSSTIAGECQSIYLKAGGRNYVLIRSAPTGGDTISVNLSAGTASSADGSPANIAIEDVGDGWYRASFTTPTLAANRFEVILSTDGVYANRSYTGDGSSGVYVWHAQHETGSVPTSPIITTGATATRAADDLQKDLSALPYTASTASSAYVKFQARLFAGQNIFEIANTLNGTNRYFVYLSTGATSPVRFFSNGGVADNTSPTTAVNTDAKYAFAFDTNDFAHTLNGNTVEADVTATLQSPQSAIGIGYSTGGAQLNGIIKEVLVLDERISNTDLVSITT